MAKTYTGVVSSDRADKTIVVTVTTRKTHPIYKKQYNINSKFMAHDENNEAKLGDSVIVSESRPISARKHFVLVKIVNKATIRHEESDATELLPKVTKPAIKTAKKSETETKETVAPEEKS